MTPSSRGLPLRFSVGLPVPAYSVGNLAICLQYHSPAWRAMSVPLICTSQWNGACEVPNESRKCQPPELNTPRRLSSSYDSDDSDAFHLSHSGFSLVAIWRISLRRHALSGGIVAQLPCTSLICSLRPYSS